MIKVGLTGGIGTGKTTVARIFECMEIPVYYADAQAKILMTQHSELKSDIIKLLGNKAYHEDGSINKNYVSKCLFGHKELSDQINQLVHPRVAEDFNNWSQCQKESPYVLKEAALIFESGSNIALDSVICLSAPVEIQIERVIRRDTLNREEIMKRIERQMDSRIKERMSDYIILNDNKHLIIPQVLEIHHKLKKLSDGEIR